MAFFENFLSTEIFQQLLIQLYKCMYNESDKNEHVEGGMFLVFIVSNKRNEPANTFDIYMNKTKQIFKYNIN